jgi:hypothetical protein
MNKNYITIAFPTINKNNTLAENDQRISEDFLSKKCLIKKTLCVCDAVYTELGESLLDSNDIWERIGTLSDEDGKWRTLVTCVENSKTGDKFYVNTEGYSYALYVGRQLKNSKNKKGDKK